MITTIVLSILMSLGPFSMLIRHQDDPKPISNQLLVQDYGFPVAEKQNNFGLTPNKFAYPALISKENLVPIFVGTVELSTETESNSRKRQKDKL